MTDTANLKNTGLKATLPRLKVLDIFHSGRQRHMSAEDVYRELLAVNEDVGLATELAREYDVPMAMAALTEQTLIEAMARGWGDKDYATPFLLQEERAGVQVRTERATPSQNRTAPTP